MKKHTVIISSRFVKNIKRMWDSPFAAYKEIVQNALRAGADTIRVTVEDGTLVVEDDGRGVSGSSSPESLKGSPSTCSTTPSCGPWP